MWGVLRVPGLIWLVVFLALVGASAGPSPPRFVRAGNFDHNPIPGAAKEVLEQADEFELLSLSPGLQFHPGKNDFHGYKILGRTFVADAETRRKLVAALERGARENQGEIAFCFNPRHGIHVVNKGKRADFVICFECFQVEVYGEGKGRFLVSKSPQPIFDRALRDAHVPLS